MLKHLLLLPFALLLAACSLTQYSVSEVGGAGHWDCTGSPCRVDPKWG